MLPTLNQLHVPNIKRLKSPSVGRGPKNRLYSNCKISRFCIEPMASDNSPAKFLSFKSVARKDIIPYKALSKAPAKALSSKSKSNSLVSRPTASRMLPEILILPSIYTFQFHKSKEFLKRRSLQVVVTQVNVVQGKVHTVVVPQLWIIIASKSHAKPFTFVSFIHKSDGFGFVKMVTTLSFPCVSLLLFEAKIAKLGISLCPAIGPHVSTRGIIQQARRRIALFHAFGVVGSTRNGPILIVYPIPCRELRRTDSRYIDFVSRP
jgi:hypothetical protein